MPRTFHAQGSRGPGRPLAGEPTLTADRGPGLGVRPTPDFRGRRQVRPRGCSCLATRGLGCRRGPRPAAPAAGRQLSPQVSSGPGLLGRGRQAGVGPGSGRGLVAGRWARGSGSAGPTSPPPARGPRQAAPGRAPFPATQGLGRDPGRGHSPGPRSLRRPPSRAACPAPTPQARDPLTPRRKCGRPPRRLTASAPHSLRPAPSRQPPPAQSAPGPRAAPGGGTMLITEQERHLPPPSGVPPARTSDDADTQSQHGEAGLCIY